VENVIPISLDEEEKMQLKRSADILTGMKEMIKKMEDTGRIDCSFRMIHSQIRFTAIAIP